MMRTRFDGRAGGFAHIVLIGDSGGSQKGMKAVAEALNAEGRDGQTRVHFVPEYYDHAGVAMWRESQGVKQVSQGRHDDFAITAQNMVVGPTVVRMKQRIKANRFCINDVKPVPADKTIEWGKKIVDYRTKATVKAITKATGR